MPFESRSQQRWMFAAEARGELPQGTARRWAHHTPNITKLPEKKRKQRTTKQATLADFLRQRVYQLQDEL